MDLPPILSDMFNCLSSSSLLMSLDVNKTTLKSDNDLKDSIKNTKKFFMSELTESDTYMLGIYLPFLSFAFAFSTLDNSSYSVVLRGLASDSTLASVTVLVGFSFRLSFSVSMSFSYDCIVFLVSPSSFKNWTISSARFSAASLGSLLNSSSYSYLSPSFSLLSYSLRARSSIVDFFLFSSLISSISFLLSSTFFFALLYSFIAASGSEA